MCYLKLFSIYFYKFYVMEHIRGVHGSVQVGFMPNPRPTRQNWVEKILTRRRPARESDRRGRFCTENTVGWSKPSTVKDPAKIVDFRQKNTKFDRDLTGSGEISLDPMRFYQIWTKYHQIYLISRQNMKICCQNLKF